MECVSGSVGRYSRSLMVLESPDKATGSQESSDVWKGIIEDRCSLILWVLTGKWSVTGFCTIEGLESDMYIHRKESRCTLMTFNSFSDPLTPLMLSLWRSWTGECSDINVTRNTRRGWMCLTHEARKALESTGNTNVGVD